MGNGVVSLLLISNFSALVVVRIRKFLENIIISAATEPPDPFWNRFSFDLPSMIEWTSSWRFLNRNKAAFPSHSAFPPSSLKVGLSQL